MIFVTVGMHHQGFDRLIKAMDELAATSEEAVIMQIGASAYEPVHAEWFRFDTQERVQELSSAARVIVGHAGAGTILAAFHCGRPIVVVPRRSGHQEHVDDHQLELARALSAQNKVVLVDEPEVQALRDGINSTAALQPPTGAGGNLAEAITAILSNSRS
ncbi:MAG: beta-1,4-galactosyltransferase [Chloroflexi bacterium]|nr:beta-1,4-galactosyltransferase [Chloroflexota bacterium]